MTDVKSQAFFRRPPAGPRSLRRTRPAGSSVFAKSPVPRYVVSDIAARYRAGVLPTVIGPWLITPRAIRLPAFPAVIAVSTGSCSSEPVGEK
jgi:hypothetical protein